MPLIDPDSVGGRLIPVLIGTILGAGLSIGVDYVRKRLNRTLLHQSHDRISTLDGETDSDGIRAIYVRVRLTNKGLETALNVRPYLLYIDRYDYREKVWLRIFDTPMDMCWSYRGAIGAVNIPANTWLFFDVVKMRSNERRLRPQTIVHPKVWNFQLQQNGKYRIGYLVSCDNIKAPMQGTMTITWSGVWNEFQCEHGTAVKQHTPVVASV